MEYFRKYLILIRRLDNIQMKPMFTNRLLIMTFIGFISGVLLDKFLSFSYAFNLIRSIISLTTGITLASQIFIIYSKIKLKKQNENSYYIPFKKRFSFRQRINLSIIIFIFIFIITLLSNKYNLLFTLKTSISVSIIFLLIAFIRKDRNEFLKDIFEIPDLKDLEHNKNKLNAIQNLQSKPKKDKKRRY